MKSKVTLSAEEGARKLYGLLYGDRGASSEKSRVVEPAKSKEAQRLPYRHKLIGVRSVEEIRADLGLPETEHVSRGDADTQGENTELDSRSFGVEERGNDESRGGEIENECACGKSSAPCVERDKYGHPVRECAECHEVRGIIGRDRCSKCYWHIPEVREKRLAKVEARKKVSRGDAEPQRKNTELDSRSFGVGERGNDDSGGDALSGAGSGKPEDLDIVDEMELVDVGAASVGVLPTRPAAKKKMPTRGASMDAFKAVPPDGEWTGLACGHTGIKGKDFYDSDQRFCKACLQAKWNRQRAKREMFEADAPPGAASPHGAAFLAAGPTGRGPGAPKGTPHKEYPPWTDEQDAEVRRVYEDEVRKRRGPGAGKPVAELAEKLGQPRWRVSKRAFQLGVVSISQRRKKEPPWSEAEYEILKKHAAVSLGNIQKKLKKAGFDRGRMAIKIKINRTIGRKPKDHHTGNSLCKCFGIDAHSVIAWIHSGLLKAEKLGTKRTARQGGDHYVIRDADIRDFIVENVEILDFRKIDKFWLVELLTTKSTESTESTEEGQKPGTTEGRTTDEHECTRIKEIKRQDEVPRTRSLRHLFPPLMREMPIEAAPDARGGAFAGAEETHSEMHGMQKEASN
jgi:hypothetical protein